MTAFQRASPDDAEALLPMMKDFYAEEGYPFDLETARAALLPLLQDDSKGRVWVIRDNGTAVGYAVLALGWSLEYRGRDAFVDEIYVVPSHRRRGLGRRALAIVDEACREIGVRALHLEVEKDNDRARDLYRTHGFADHDRVLMSKRFD
jgi:ribosomal protein S18 acetylase RimI-like enzyme